MFWEVECMILLFWSLIAMPLLCFANRLSTTRQIQTSDAHHANFVIAITYLIRFGSHPQAILKMIIDTDKNSYKNYSLGGDATGTYIFNGVSCSEYKPIHTVFFEQVKIWNCNLFFSKSMPNYNLVMVNYAF